MPVVGALLNMPLFGMADILVGRYKTGVRKFLLYLVCVYIFIIGLRIISALFGSESFTVLLLWFSTIGYCLFAAFKGYAVVRTHGKFK